MWAQEWQNLYDIMIPYKGKSNVDVTSQMQAQVSMMHFITFVCLEILM